MTAIEHPVAKFARERVSSAHLYTKPLPHVTTERDADGALKNLERMLDPKITSIPEPSELINQLKSIIEVEKQRNPTQQTPGYAIDTITQTIRDIELRAKNPFEKWVGIPADVKELMTKR